MHVRFPWFPLLVALPLMGIAGLYIYQDHTSRAACAAFVAGVWSALFAFRLGGWWYDFRRYQEYRRLEKLYTGRDSYEHSR